MADRVVEVFADVGCPFTHAGLQHLVAERERRDRHDVVLRVRCWPLEVVNGAPLDPAHLEREIVGLRAGVTPDLFAGFDRHGFPPSTVPAMALSAHANEMLPTRQAETVALELRWALFEEGRNIARDHVLADIAERHDLEASGADPARVLADHVDGRARGVVGSPHFFAGSDADGVFCPTLDITKTGEDVRVTLDQRALDEFHARVFD